MAILLTTSYQKIGTISLDYGEIRFYGRYYEQNQANNYTNFQLKTTYYTNQNYLSFSSATAYIDGTRKDYGYTTIYRGETTLMEEARTQYHNEDGSSPIRNVGASWSATFGGGGSVYVDVTFPKIDRYPMITSAPDFSDEDNPTVTFTTNVGFTDYITEIAIKHNWDDDPLANYRQVNVANGSYTFNLTNEERTAIRNETPNSNTMTVIFSLRTSVGSNVYFSTITRTLSIVNADPEISSLTVTETNQDVIDVLGSATSNSIISGVSSLHAVVVPIANKGASIARVTLVRGGTVTSDTTSPYEFDFSPGASQTIIVTDSRGNSAGVTINKTVLPYIPVSFVNFTFERDNPTSSDIILNLEANYIQQTYNQTPNVPIVKWKLDDGAFNTIPSTEYIIDTTNHKLIISDYELTNLLDYRNKGNFTISIEDLFTSAVDTQYVLKGIPTFDYGEHDLKVNGDLFIADTNGENAVNVKDLHIIDLETNGSAVPSGRIIDGHIEYVKRIQTTISSSTNKSVATGLTAGTHEITDLKGYITNNSATGIKVKDGFYYGADNSFMIHVINGTNIQVITGRDTGWIAANDVCILEVYYINLND